MRRGLQTNKILWKFSNLGLLVANKPHLETYIDKQEMFLSRQEYSAILLTFVFVAVVILVFFVALIPNEGFAHRDGCHRWHSCPSDSGSYVCGDLGIDTYCPKQGFIP